MDYLKTRRISRGDYLLEDAAMSRVDEILSDVTGAAELEVIRYTA